MKAGKEHRVPLATAAVKLLQDIARVEQNIFPGVRGRPVTTDPAMKLLKELRPALTAHGFRSTIRD